MLHEMGSAKYKRKTELLHFWLRLVCFVTLLVMVLCYTSYVLTPKYEYGIGSMMNLYYQKKNTIDVLVVGTSQAYCSVNTNVLWSEYGIASYDLCSAEQAYWNSYYYLVEALKRQTPELIILDAKAATYQDDYQKRGRVILSTFGILSPTTRIEAIAASSKPEDFLSCVLSFPQLHRQYNNLSIEDFMIPSDNNIHSMSWKGFIGMDEHETHSPPSIVWTSTKRDLNERQEEYLLKIFQLAETHQITVLLVAFPYPDYEHDHMFYNTLWGIAEDHHIEYMNFNDPSLRYGLRYTTDFADWQHLNIKGSITFSKELGARISALYALPDRRNSPEYSSYDECFQLWQESLPEFFISDGNVTVP